MKKVFILGSNSFSGNHLVTYMLKKNYKVIGCSYSDRSLPKFNPTKSLKPSQRRNYIFFKVNINKNFDKLERQLLKHKPSVIIDFMGQGMVSESWEFPYLTFKTNVLSKIKLYNFLIKKKFLKKYIKISTPEIFGSSKIKGSGYNRHNPSTPYALTHSTIENYLLLICKQFSFPVIISRFANFYGPYQKLYRLIPLAIHKAFNKKKFYLHGGGYSKRSFIYTDDFCEGILKMIKFGKVGECYQFSSKEYITIKSVVEKIYKIKKLNPAKYIVSVPDRVGKDKDYIIDDRYTRKILNWSNKVSFDLGIKKVFEWYESYTKNFNKKDEVFKIKI